LLPPSGLIIRGDKDAMVPPTVSADLDKRLKTERKPTAA